MVVVPSTHRTVDNIVVAVAIVGLSAIFARWRMTDDIDSGGRWDSGGVNDRPPPESSPSCTRVASSSSTSDGWDGKSGRKRRRGMRMMNGWIPWWWPVIAMRRWNGRHNNYTTSENHNSERIIARDDGLALGEKISLNNDNADDDEIDDGMNLHQGSCHCGSIKFVLRGPRRLQALDSPGKIRYPHVIVSAGMFQLISGGDRIRFYYEDDNIDAAADDDPSSSSVAFFDRAGEGRRDDDDAANQALGAHGFCGNCGVHVFHADRSSGNLEVNANCLDSGTMAGTRPARGEHRASSSGVSCATNTKNIAMASQSLQSQPTMGDVGDVDEIPGLSAIEIAASEYRSFPEGSASLPNRSDYRCIGNSVSRKESLSSEPTQSESYSTAIMMAEGDDSSLGSSLSVITGAYLTSNHSSHNSVESGSASARTHDMTDRVGGRPPPLSSSRIMSSDRSARTLPPRLGEQRLRYGPGGVSVGGGINGSGWSVASMESNDLDGSDMEQTLITPRMRDQMKKYLGRHINPIQED